MSDPCVTCKNSVQTSEQAIACDLCKEWEHVACMDTLYQAMMACRSKVLVFVCSQCIKKGLEYELSRVTDKLH